MIIDKSFLIDLMVVDVCRIDENSFESTDMINDKNCFCYVLMDID